eukprot:COSAG04_NODE_5638_length_1544_cov_1.250519_2_plen_74_part_00
MQEETGFVYAIGSQTCLGGPHIVDIREPESPSFVGCVDQDGYTHDAECVIWHGVRCRCFLDLSSCLLANPKGI